MTKKSFITKILKKAKPDLPEILPAPEIPVNLNQNAQWLSGEGAGSWFEFLQVESNFNNFKITRYSPEGKCECSSIFRTSGEFKCNHTFEINYPCNCNEVTVIQNERIFHFYRLESK